MDKRHIITTAIEHHAVLRTLQALEEDGFSVTYLPVDGEGMVTAEDVANAITPKTYLVSVMFANNEIGTVEPVPAIVAVCRERGVMFHTDAVQAVGHVPLNVDKMQIDMLSLSAHKFHGVKGAGALYMRQDCAVRPLLFGGGQERGRRAGTENVPGAVAMAAALQEACAHLLENAAYVSSLRDRLFAGLRKIPECFFNGSMTQRLPGNVHVCFAGVEGLPLLILLN